MHEKDYSDLLKHLRELVKGSEFADMDNIASLESSSIPSAKRRLETYLYMVVNMLTERSGDKAVSTYDKLNWVLETEQGRLEGIDVELSDAEASHYGITKYSLHQLDNYSSAIIELRNILDELKHEPEPPRNDFNNGPKL